MAAALDGRVALVTGAGRGIGREIAIGLAAAGAQVALVARTAQQLDEVAHVISAAGGIAVAMPVDISDVPAASAVVVDIVSRLGRIDALVNNAAVVAPLGPTASLDPALVDAALKLNVTAVVVLTGLVLPGMLRNGWGRIVNISSGIAQHPAGMVGGTVYAASKAALEAHTLNLAAELDGTGVTANVYRPGAVDTAMQAWIREQPPSMIGPQLHDRFVEMYASGTLRSPQRSAARLLENLIASDESGQIWSAGD
jgi:NAD(P)-dependent dehydrogenase (short-subunit alcohol dehydrogenase family)